MAELVRMPKMSDTMEQGVISKWLKKVGDEIHSGDILAEVETDKAIMELEAYSDGTLLYIGVQEKEIACVNAIVAILGKAEEDIADLIKSASVTLASHASESIGSPVVLACEEQRKHQDHGVHTRQIKRMLISPLAKKIAQGKGYDLTTIQGSGDHGRIIKRDLEQFAVKKFQMADMSYTGQEAYEEVPVSPIRETIARVLTDNSNTIPHFYLTVRVNMDQVVISRASINAYTSVKISFNDFIIKAVAIALKQYPKINAAWCGKTIRYYKDVHIGIAVAEKEGLFVPVIRFVDQQSLTKIANEVTALRTKVSEKKLRTEDYEGATFTISNLGMFGIDFFTSIINPPAACILAVGAIQKIPIIKEENIVPSHVMHVTLSCDHRVVDGAIGAVFLKKVKDLLEDPIKMIV